MAPDPTSADKVRLVADFVRGQVDSHRPKKRPLFVGVQGPQGAGKSFITALVPEALARPDHGSLQTASLSLDDLYLTRQAQSSLAASHPDNPMLQGRGPPGTHDLALARRILSALKAINDSPDSAVPLPNYDKSAFDGQGDRSSQTTEVRGPIDVVILEGWCVGFRAVPVDVLRRRHDESPRSANAGDEDTHPSTLAERKTPFFADHSLNSLLALNEALETYDDVGGSLDALVELKPQDLSFVWQWRLEQEHAMKRDNGGRGMTDEQVGAFIARYMPCYELFAPDPMSSSFSGRHLRLVLDRRRAVQAVEYP